MHRSSKTPVLCVVLAAVVVALVGASQASTATTANTLPANPLATTLKSLSGLKYHDWLSKVTQMAAEEGQVNVYTSLSSLVQKPLEAAWAQQFPNVKLNMYRASSEDVTAKVLAERSANASGADVIETNGTNMLIFQHQKNVLVPYTTDVWRKQVPKAFQYDTFTADRLEKFVVAWNTNLVKDPPRSFAQLADPKWAGKLAIEPTDVDWFATLYQYFEGKIGKAKADTMFKAISANAQVINGHTAQANLLAAGQVQVIVSGHAQSIEQLQAKKAPIAFSPFVLPVVERPQGMGIAYRLPHPAAAMLFYNWLLSPTGQKILQANGVVPANPYYPDSAFASKPFTIRVDERPIVANYQSWSKVYSGFTSLGKAG